MNTALNTAVPSQATGFDPGAPLPVNNATFQSHFAAAIASAKLAVAALIGNAPRVSVTIAGYTDSAVTQPLGGPGMTSSKITITAVETW
jgi:hypothetical protein